MRWVNISDMVGKAHLINLAHVVQVVTEPTQYKVFLISLESFSINKEQFQLFVAAITKSNTEN